MKDLLGINLETMKTYENSTLVETWISKHTNVEVASLGIGLKGGNKIPVPGGVIDIPGECCPLPIQMLIIIRNDKNLR